MKTVKELETPDLLELTLQLHSRANRVMNKEMHDAYVEARQELDSRILVNKISANVPIMRSLQQDSEMLFHECPNCNIRCNCSEQPCSCCNVA